MTKKTDYILDDIFNGKNEFYSFREASKIINKKGLGRNNLLKLLREKDVLDQFNKPSDEWIELAFAKRSDDFYKTPLISTYGINYVKKHFLD